MRTLQTFVSTLAVLFAASVLWSQTGTSTITGTVTDPQGRVVTGATLTLTNPATGTVRTGKSSDAGAYNFDFLVPGEYKLEVEASGFKKKNVTNVRALVGKTTESNVQLEVGASTEVVEVRDVANQFLINTEDATLGNNFVSEQITQLPLEARNIVDLLSLQPGATREGYVTGSRADQSNVTLDGVDINNAQTGNADVPKDTNSLSIGQLDTDRGDITNGPVLRLNSEAIEEFRVTTANANANQGRSSGSQINLVTKSGTNALHGSAFEFYRSRGFTANDWFNIHSDPQVERLPLVRNTFAGALGGPVIKNKAFFFYSYEGRRDASGQSVANIVPLDTLGQGQINYTYCTDASCNNTANASLSLAQVQQVYSVAGINPAALDALAAAAAKYPANDSSVGDGLNTAGFRFNSATPVSLNSHVAKFDFNLTNAQNLFVRVNVIHDHQTLTKWLPDAVAPQVWNHPWGLAAGHTWAIGSNWVNNLRYGYTRQAFDDGGDSFGNDIAFRFVFQPNGERHTVSRVTPVHNITDDVSWVHGNHTIQFGGNVRMISNARTDFSNAFDFADTNPSFYNGAGNHVSTQFQNYLIAQGLPGGVGDQSLASSTEVQNAATALIGRLNEYTADFNFGKDGSLLGAGAPTIRNFATQAYDMYVQDAWKLRPNFTLTLGLRYGLERPVYEKNGFEVQPETSLSTFFKERMAAAAQGNDFIDPIVINRSGPANGGKPMYNWDKNNFQPRIAVAWSPNGGDGFWGRLVGKGGQSVVRGGFSMTNDYYGQALAVDWDLNNTLGFTSQFNINANTFDTVSPSTLGPQFQSFDQEVRTLPQVQIPLALQFPLSQPNDFQERIEHGVDSDLHAPTSYVWNLTLERQLPKGLVVSASYIGRMGRDLLARRDVAAFNDVRDPVSKMDWYTAGAMLEKLRQKDTDVANVPDIPFFNNLFPAGQLAQLLNADNGLPGGSTDVCGVPNIQWNPSWTNTQAFYATNSRNTMGPTEPGNCFFSGNDWTDTEVLVDTALADSGNPMRFVHPAYGALSAWSTIGNSNYNALTLSVRQRYKGMLLDFNYTWSHSLDDASGLQNETSFSGFGNQNGNGAFIVNPLRQRDSYGNSDFDVRHIINADAVWSLPMGKGQSFLSSAHGLTQALVGGWQLSGIFRWNTGLPSQSPTDDSRWATNWNVQANVTPLKPLHSCPGVLNGQPKMFDGSCGSLDSIYRSFRNAYPGETGPRNYLRQPGYVDLDLGLGKTFTMPWSESHQLQLRWDAFNVTNTQHFGTIDFSRTGNGVGLDPALTNLTAPSGWSNLLRTQGQPRIMQIGARYSF
jgi:hypothetical protein